MIRCCIFLIFAVLPFCGLQAQDTAVGPGYPGAGHFEGEVAAGATFGYASLGSFDNDAAGFVWPPKAATISGGYPSTRVCGSAGRVTRGWLRASARRTLL